VAHFGNLLGFGQQRRSPPQGVFVKIPEGVLPFPSPNVPKITVLPSNFVLRLIIVANLGFTPNTGIGEVYAMAPLTDGSGKIYVGGSFTTYTKQGLTAVQSKGLVRLNSDWTVDNTFAVGAGFNAHVNNIAIAKDGSGDVYVGGAFTTYDGNSGINRIVRLNSDGSIDTGFNAGTGFNSDATSIVISNDGSRKIYVGGNFTSYNGVTTDAAVRLKDNGQLD
jgi:beta-propeller uncharacterized protein DUF5122